MLVGIILLVLVFKTGKAFTRFLFFIIAVGLFAGAYWWHNTNDHTVQPVNLLKCHPIIFKQ